MKPPRVAVAKLKEMGYTVEYWTYRKGWWVGYAKPPQAAICTICLVTGKAMIEVCKRFDYAEIIGNFDC